MASDFHTHRLGTAARTLVSCTPEEIGKYPLASLQLHPWFLPEKVEPFTPEFLAAAEQATALGEAGLDRLRGPSFAVQQAWLGQLLELAGVLKKPVVFHCVRALPELLQAVRNFRGHKLFHGFRGKPEMLEQLRVHDFFVSLSPKVVENSALFRHLRQNGFERVGFETDDSGKSIEDILCRAAGIMEMSYSKLEEETDRNFDLFLRKE